MANLFRRKQDKKHILSGYQVGDVRSNLPTIVEEGSIIVGDIFAPQVIVAGMIYGYVVSGEVVIEPTGQIWGDICAATVTAMPGSKIHGWISSLDVGTVDLLRLGQLSVEEVPVSGEFAIAPDIARVLARLVPQMEQENLENARRVEIWRILQSEAAVAISARRELEYTFANQVREAATEIQNFEQVPGSDAIEDPDKNRLASGERNNQPDYAPQLVDAENEVRQLRTQLATVLRRQVLIRNQLLWTKATLRQTKELKHPGSKDEDQEPSNLDDGLRGRHLANLQATIAERDIKIQDLQAQIVIQEEQFSRLRTLATKRIETLESELSQANLRKTSK